jgi:hypothetical protein
MKQFILVLLLICNSITNADEGTKIKSKVIEAAVFKNRAMVTREAEIDLSIGKHKIIFSDLTTNIEDASVRVSANNDASIKILDVHVERRFTTEIQQTDAKDMQKQIDSLNRLMQDAYDQTDILNSKKEFVESLKAQSLTVYNQKILMNISSTKNWNEMLNFVDTNLNEIFTNLRKENLKKENLKNQITALANEINKNQGSKRQNYKEIIVNVETKEKGKVKLNPSYIVQNASWYPIYDSRVNSQSKNIEFYYYGMIQQSTGEDWTNINLTLSTAEPLSVKTLPELDRWFLNTNQLPIKTDNNQRMGAMNSQFQVSYDQNWGIPAGKGTITGYITDAATGDPLIGANILIEGTNIGSAADIDGKFYLANVPKGYKNMRVNYAGYQPMKIKIEVAEKYIANIDVPLNASPISVDEIIVTAEKFYEEKSTNAIKVISSDEIQPLPTRDKRPTYTNVYAKELSTVFDVPYKSNIPSDNSPHKVTIAIEDLPIKFEYTSIPKIQQSVYLKGKVTNNKTYPLLEGELNIFVDNDFINRTYLNTVVPTDTLEMDLGIDERINAERILVNRYQESTGLLSGGKRIIYEYEIKITNNRTTEEKILLFDQIPIAMNEDIKIELITPAIEEKDLRRDGKLEWKLNLKPGENKVIPIKFRVEFPNGVNVFGLE